ncbi:serine hydrolase domain-containing protein [Phenylobacterium immobile]|uniref:serine hydrolase domain-containing protein n=1 Tax=Phenylobacterium immobile TaxID=21 RepID=UPI000A9DB7B2|nr:serine hydrolase domain-containing protein [Phenylobacterium immobile]
MNRPTPHRRGVLAGGAALTLAACAPKAATSPNFTELGLATLEAALERHVTRGSIPGAVGLVSRGGETQVFTAGFKALQGAEPMQRDTIFRIASMTKPLTATAVMMLIDEGKFILDEPAERLLPELANRRVLARPDAPLSETVPANRPITLRDILNFTLGWGVSFENTPILQATQRIPGFGMPDAQAPFTNDAFMAALGALPLMAQPGDRWLYSLGSNIQGVLVARASGLSLPDFLARRVTGPLGMSDTAFFVPPEKLSRLATAYMPRNGQLELYDAPNGRYAKPPSFAAGDSGLVSTLDDYLAFARFLMTGQAPDGRPLLSARSLDEMKTNHLTKTQRWWGRQILTLRRGWGYGMGVVMTPTPEGLRAGAYGWDGGFGTSWFNDPARDLTAILLTQRLFDTPDPPQIHKDFQAAAMKALV